MATSKGTQGKLVGLLNSLIELDYDAIEAYKAAISRMDDMSDRSALAGFQQDHERHVVDLSTLVTAMNEVPKTHGDYKQVLTKGKVVIGGLVGDRVVLSAMKSNEDDTNTAYERAVAHEGLTEAVRLVLERNLGDECRHRAWIERRMTEAESTTKLKKAS